MKEGKMKKGGQNLTYQITERPPDPPPMRSGFLRTTGRVTFEPMASGTSEHVLRTRAGLVHCAWCGAECQPRACECWHCKTALLPLTVPSKPPCPTCSDSGMVGTGQPSDEGGEAFDRCPDCGAA